MAGARSSPAMAVSLAAGFTPGLLAGPLPSRRRSRAKHQQEVALFVKSHRVQKFRVFAGADKRNKSKFEAIMVDPLEAKRLAKIQMQEIKAKERLKKRLYIEAINGAWAMLGLTAGLIIEGGTGKGILAQLAGYLDALINIF